MSDEPVDRSAENPHKIHTGWRRVVHATRHSARGLRDAWKFESAFRQEIALFLLVLPLGAWLGRNWVERVLLIGTVMLVLIVELLNSAVESTVDRVSLDHHELSRRAKDLGSAAVMVSLLLCGAVWTSAAWVRFTA
ncbi:MAG: diacylglycerol kinase [Betaproteobacteria bacterium]